MSSSIAHKEEIDLIKSSVSLKDLLGYPNSLERDPLEKAPIRF